MCSMICDIGGINETLSREFISDWYCSSDETDDDDDDDDKDNPVIACIHTHTHTHTHPFIHTCIVTYVHTEMCT